MFEPENLPSLAYARPPATSGHLSEAERLETFEKSQIDWRRPASEKCPSIVSRKLLHHAASVAHGWSTPGESSPQAESRRAWSSAFICFAGLDTARISSQKSRGSWSTAARTSYIARTLSGAQTNEQIASERWRDSRSDLAVSRQVNGGRAPRFDTH
jgi:hypothetical protein